MRKLFWPLLLVFAAAALAAGLASGGNGDTNKKTFEYAIGLWGDLPYNAAQEAALPNLFADMNQAQLAFSVNDGDLKAGSGPCPNELYQKALGWFNSLEGAAMFTPGDNDWTDCDRNPGVNSLERLNYERQTLFSTPYSFGTHPMLQEVQAAPYVENRRWTVKGVTYATVNIQGSCNNLCDTAPDAAEEAARNAADIAWLQDTFKEAKDDGSAAVMIVGQADPGFDATDAMRAPLRDPRTLAETDGQPDGYQSFLLALRNLTIDFRRPVVYVHGDSHYFRVDRPFLDSHGRRLEDFTRVETFGDNQANGTNDVQWLKVLVDPHSRDVFAFQPQIVPANRVAVPAP
jgi:hypothetical protein